MASKLSKRDLTEQAATVHGLLLDGDTDDEIMERLGIAAEDYSTIVKHMLDTKVEAVRSKTREQICVEYEIAQNVNIKKLNDLVSKLDADKQYNAIIGAIRLRSEIIDKILDRKMDLGLVKKQPARTEIIAGVMIADLSDVELRKSILGQGKLLAETIERFGDASMLDLPKTPLHYGEPAFITTADEMEEDDAADVERALNAKKATGTHRSKTKKAKGSRSAIGRRVHT